LTAQEVKGDCPEGKVCENEKCVEKPPECTTDADCPDGKECKDGKCVEKSKPECTTDADCPEGKICENEKCVPEPKVCGDGICEGGETCGNCEDDCGACPEPELIVNCPKDVKAGTAAKCSVKDENNNPVSDTTVTLNMPDGTTETFRTDADGNVEFTTHESGKIDVSASKTGYAEGEKAHVSVSVSKETPLSWYLLPLLLILVLVILLVFRKKKKTALESAE